MADALRRSSSSKQLDRSHQLDEDAIATQNDVPVVEAPIMKFEPTTEPLRTLPAVELRSVEPPHEGCFGRLPRITWLFSAYILTGLISVTWLVYSCVRYARAIQGEPVLMNVTVHKADSILSLQGPATATPRYSHLYGALICRADSHRLQSLRRRHGRQGES